MRVRVLGAAAGGGFPQWNCNCEGCRRARAGDPAARPRTQASVAVSADGLRWVLLNASPDLVAQINANECLQPAAGGPLRGSPIGAVVISSGDIDCIAGLLSMREGQAFALYAEGFVLGVLERDDVFRVLNRDLVTFYALGRGEAVALTDGAGVGLGLVAEAFAVAGKVPLYQELSDDIAALRSDEAVVGLCISGGGKRFYYVPGCGAVTAGLKERVWGADLLLFDGTLWRDDEMILAGTGRKTGQRMGHVSISGPAGALAGWRDVMVGERVFVHINNTNPILRDDSEEAVLVRAAGWRIGFDGMEFTL